MLSTLKDEFDVNRYGQERPQELDKDGQQDIAGTQNDWPILNKKNLAHLNRSAANF